MIDGGHRTTPSVLLVPQTGRFREAITRSTRDGKNKSLWLEAYSISSSFCKYFLWALRAVQRPLQGLTSSRQISQIFASLGYTQFSVNSTSVIDLEWLGRPRSIACALVRSKDSVALIDPGPASTIPTLKNKLAIHGLSIAEIDAILLTHIHLDHAGATGSLVRENPKLKVYVHLKGVPHLLDPTKLLQSATRLWGDDLFRRFGEFLPVPQANLEILEGGEAIALGSRTLQVLYTPGHAVHHVTYFDLAAGTAFVGDNAGICVNGDPFVLPATPPPDLSIELWDRSLDVIAALHPKKLFLTHFSYSENPLAHIESYRERLHRWSDLSGEILASNSDERTALQRFTEGVAEEAARYLAPDELSLYLFNGALDLSWLGMARYHRKRAEAASQNLSQ